MRRSDDYHARRILPPQYSEPLGRFALDVPVTSCILRTFEDAPTLPLRTFAQSSADFAAAFTRFLNSFGFEYEMTSPYDLQFRFHSFRCDTLSNDHPTIRRQDLA